MSPHPDGPYRCSPFAPTKTTRPSQQFTCFAYIAGFYNCAFQFVPPFWRKRAITLPYSPASDWGCHLGYQGSDSVRSPI